MNEKPDFQNGRFYRDDGTEINPELVTKSSLCVTCKNDNNPDEEVLCILTRADQEDEADFRCYAYDPLKRY